MYAKYNYAAGSTLQDVLGDVVSMLTGTVTKASLSAACVQANTEIYAPGGDNAGYAAPGWTLHDSFFYSPGTCYINQVTANATTDIITVLGGGHALVANDTMRFSTTGGGVTAGVDYYVMTTSLNQATGTFRISTSANDVGPVNLTGTLSSYFFWVTSGTQRASTINVASHTYTVNAPIKLTGTVPAPLVSGTTYYVKSVLNTEAITISDTPGGTAISITAAGSGTPTVTDNRRQVVKAPVADNGAFYKYVMLNVVNSSYLQMYLYESWNATTHAGVNQATDIGASYQQRLNISAGGTLLIGASARYTIMQSTIPAGIGSSTSNAWTGVFERSRLAPWDTSGGGYSPSLITWGGAFGHFTGGVVRVSATTPRFKNPAGGDYVDANAYVYPVTMGWSGEPNDTAICTGVGYEATSGVSGKSGAIKTKVPDGVGGFYTPLTEIQFRKSLNGFVFEGGSISSICDVWLTVSYPNNVDEVTKGSTNYIIFQNTNLATSITDTTAGGSSANIAIPKG